MSRERRGFARLYVGVEAIYRQKDKENTVLVQDISISGVRFISNEDLDENLELYFTLNIPDLAVPITATGKVIWQKKFSESFYDTGIEFINMDLKARETLSEYIKQSLGRVEENREFVRSNLSTMVSYKLASNPAEEKRCISVDISPTGVKVFIKEKLENNTELDMSFLLPEDKELIVAKGKVIWCRDREEKFCECGIEFIEIEGKYVDKINHYVKKTLGIEW